MAVDTSEKQALLTRYVEDLNEVAPTREFVPFVKKWFTPDATLTIHHRADGLDAAKVIWEHFLPVGGPAPRVVLQMIYKIDDGRVYSWRQLEGGNAPKPLYGMQETEFNDRGLISEIVIHSVQDKPEVEVDPAAEKTRLARMFLAFADAFNDFFVSGDTGPVEEWCDPDVRMIIDSAFHGMGVVAPHNRINANATFSLGDIEPLGEDTVRAVVDFKNWAGIDGAMPWEVTFTPDGKVRKLGLTLAL